LPYKISTSYSKYRYNNKYYAVKLQAGLKGQCHEIFNPRFFHQFSNSR
jgi:hypothetical protein